MTADKECLWCFNQDDFQNISRERTGYLKWAKEMESSKRYLLQAEIEYWHEMLQLNQRRISKIKEEEMPKLVEGIVAEHLIRKFGKIYY